MTSRAIWFTAALLVVLPVSTLAGDVTGAWKGTMQFVTPKGLPADQSVADYRAACGRMIAVLEIRKNKTFFMQIKKKPGLTSQGSQHPAFVMKEGTFEGTWTLAGEKMTWQMRKHNGQPVPTEQTFHFVVGANSKTLTQAAEFGLKTTFTR